MAIPSVQSIVLSFLFVFSIFYLGVGLYRWFLWDSLDESNQENTLSSQCNLKIILSFATAVSGFIVICTRSRIFKIIYLFILVVGICLTVYKILTTENFTGNSEFRSALLDTIRNNRTDSALAKYLQYYEEREKCCGVNGKMDYILGEKFELPISCCTIIDEITGCTPENAHSEGCWQYFEKDKKENESSDYRLSLIVLFTKSMAGLLTLALFRKENLNYY